MQVIPLSPVPSQSLSVVLGTQNCQIVLSQKTTGLFFTLTVDNAIVVSGRIVRDRAFIVRVPYSSFEGEFMVLDTQGASDPEYAGLGGRWQLVYLP